MSVNNSVFWLVVLMLALVFTLIPRSLRRLSHEASYQFNAASYQFNAASWRSLPPVDCPLLIRVSGEVIRATRTSHIERLDGEMDYLADDGRTFTGRYDWTYP